MDVLLTHKQVVEDYASYIQSFLNIADPAIRATVESKLAEGRLWPEPLLQFNPAYESAGTVEAVAANGILHSAIPDILKGYSLYKHQVDAIKLVVKNIPADHTAKRMTDNTAFASKSCCSPELFNDCTGENEGDVVSAKSSTYLCSIRSSPHQ